MLHAHLAALALAVTTLAASGCGESSKTGSATTAAAAAATTATTATPPTTTTSVKPASGKSLTRTQLIAKGDAICARAHTKLSAMSASTQKEFARLLPQAAIYDNTESNELSELVPPASMAHDWAQIISSAHLYGEYISRVADYARANNFRSATPLLHASENVQKQLIAVATHDGFKHCSQAS